LAASLTPKDATVSMQANHWLQREQNNRTLQASGEVWVNTETGVFHRGGKWYGATKQGNS
jgi:hypothetical protein